MKRAALFQLALGSLLVAGCGGGAIQKPTRADATLASERWPGTTVADLDAGRTLYVGRCGTCHELYEPAHFREPEWRDNLAQMRERAKVRPDEEELILRYVVAVGSRPPASP